MNRIYHYRHTTGNLGVLYHRLPLVVKKYRHAGSVVVKLCTSNRDGLRCWPVDRWNAGAQTFSRFQTIADDDMTEIHIESSETTELLCRSCAVPQCSPFRRLCRLIRYLNLKCALEMSYRDSLFNAVSLTRLVPSICSGSKDTPRAASAPPPSPAGRVGLNAPSESPKQGAGSFPPPPPSKWKTAIYTNKCRLRSKKRRPLAQRPEAKLTFRVQLRCLHLRCRFSRSLVMVVRFNSRR